MATDDDSLDLDGIDDPSANATDPDSAVETEGDSDVSESSTEIDWSKVDPSTIPQQVVEQTTAFAGLRRDLQDHRTRVQELAQANTELTKQLDQGTSDEANPLEVLGELEDDDVVTAAQMKAIVERVQTKVLKQQEQAAKQLEANQARQRLVESETSARKKYAPGRVPQGLDFDTVLAEATAHLRQTDPALLQGLLAGADPAEAIYNYALGAVPSVRQRALAAERTKVVDGIRQGRIPGGQLAGMSSGTDAGEASVLADLVGAVDPAALAAKTLAELAQNPDAEDF